jgi:hypothetical protein
MTAMNGTCALRTTKLLRIATAVVMTPLASGGPAIAQSIAPRHEPAQVSFVHPAATAFEAVKEIGLATHTPIGIALGRNWSTMCDTKTAFELRDVDAKGALLVAAERAHYELSEEDGVLLLTAPDLTPYQRAELDHSFSEYKSGRGGLVVLGSSLSTALWADFTHPTGFAGSILDSPDDPPIELPPVQYDVTAQQIANQLVTKGVGGMWIAKISPEPSNNQKDFEVSLYSYAVPSAFDTCGR